jgi:hypothetical protein
MTFTKIGSILAQIIFGLAIFRIISAVVLIFSGNEPVEIANLLGSSTTTSQILDQAFVWAVVAVTLGIPVNISNAVNQKKVDEGE